MNLSVASQILEENPLGVQLIYTLYDNSGSSFHPHALSFPKCFQKRPADKIREVPSWTYSTPPLSYSLAILSWSFRAWSIPKSLGLPRMWQSVLMPQRGLSGEEWLLHRHEYLSLNLQHSPKNRTLVSPCKELQPAHCGRQNQGEAMKLVGSQPSSWFCGRFCAKE